MSLCIHIINIIHVHVTTITYTIGADILLFLYHFWNLYKMLHVWLQLAITVYTDTIFCDNNIPLNAVLICMHAYRRLSTCDKTWALQVSGGI